MTRKKLAAKDKIHEYSDIILTNFEECKKLKGKWQSEIFKNTNPLFIEIGSGKGQFLNALAQKNPQNNYLGIEIKEERLLSSAKKVKKEKLANIRFLKGNIAEITRIFKTSEVTGIYINFPDPWPKKRHIKRRMTSDSFLPIYTKILQKDGFIALKTDNPLVFHYSCANFLQNKWKIEEETLDLKQNSDNIETEFEQKYRKRGLSIYYAKFNKNY